MISKLLILNFQTTTLPKALNIFELPLQRLLGSSSCKWKTSFLNLESTCYIRSYEFEIAYNLFSKVNMKLNSLFLSNIMKHFFVGLYSKLQLARYGRDIF